MMILRTLTTRFQEARTHNSLFSSFRRTLSRPSQLELAPPVTRNHDTLEPLLIAKLKQADSETQVMACLDDSGIAANSCLVYSVIWELRQEWRLAYSAFNWGHNWGCSADEKVCELMVWVLGSSGKFNIAWCLIRDMYKASFSTRRSMLLLIDRYAAANDPGKAIKTFHIMEKFRITPDEEAFTCLLSSLCEHGNIEEAEEFMLLNKKMFPLETGSFNIILNGWCNISVDVFEAKRIWREMSSYCLTPDATSYTHMISCFSRVGNLFDSLRLYDEMKKRGWVPGLKVYNSLVYVLTQENCFEEALKVLEKMKLNGVQPDSATYHSMIVPLCEAKKMEEAKNVLASMTAENHQPTTEIYHAFLEGVNYNATVDVLAQMKTAGLGPNGETFIIILCKFLKLNQPDDALKIWVEMKQYGVVQCSNHYKVLIEGLISCGLKMKAKEYHAEMKLFGFVDDPKLKKLLEEPVGRKVNKKMQDVRNVKGDKPTEPSKGHKMRWIKNHRKSRTKRKKVEKSDPKL